MYALTKNVAVLIQRTCRLETDRASLTRSIKTKQTYPIQSVIGCVLTVEKDIPPENIQSLIL